MSLTPRLEVLLAPKMFEVFVINGEVGREHASRDFVAVVAVADENVD